MLLSSTLDSFRQGLPISELPRTFQDLIVLARAFGVRYMWIDALCIIQDSTEDWEHEGAAMWKVYANSLCTIAATASISLEDGLFRKRDPVPFTRQIKAPSGHPCRDNHDYHVFDLGFAERCISSGPLQSRGWAFQERIMSPRVLHFSDSQMLWECRKETQCEAAPFYTTLLSQKSTKGSIQHQGMRNRLEVTADHDAESSASLSSSTPARNHVGKEYDVFLDGWKSVVAIYSNCSLTYDEDKLPALAGLAKAFLRDKPARTYLAGMWRENLEGQLGWKVNTPGNRLSTPYRAPSWFWASVTSAIEPSLYYKLEKLGHCFYTIPRIESVSCVTKGPQYFGRVLRAHLEVSGYLVFPIVHSIDGEKEPQTCQLRIEHTFMSACLCWDTVDVRASVGFTITCLPLGIEYDTRIITCIILEQVGGNSPIKYQRVGLLKVTFGHDRSDQLWRFGIEKGIKENRSVAKYNKEFSVIHIV